MTVETMPFDEAKYLEDAESQRFLLNDAIESGDPRYIAYSLRVVARARGMNQQSSEVGEALREEGDLRLSTLTSVLSALNFKLSIDLGTNSATE